MGEVPQSTGRAAVSAPPGPLQDGPAQLVPGIPPTGPPRGGLAGDGTSLGPARGEGREALQALVPTPQGVRRRHGGEEPFVQGVAEHRVQPRLHGHHQEGAVQQTPGGP